MYNLNERFNTTKPILDAIFSEIGESELSDGLFNQACDEFNMADVDVMELMMDSEKYNFIRLDEGWTIELK